MNICNCIINLWHPFYKLSLCNHGNILNLLNNSIVCTETTFNLMTISFPFYVYNIFGRKTRYGSHVIILILTKCFSIPINFEILVQHFSPNRIC